MKLSRKFLSVLLAVVLTTGLVPALAFAGNSSSADAQSVSLSSRIAALVATGDSDASEIVAAGLRDADEIDAYYEGLTEEETRYVALEMMQGSDGQAVFNIIIYASPRWGAPSASAADGGAALASTDSSVFQERCEKAWDSVSASINVYGLGITTANIYTRYIGAIIDAPEQFNVRTWWYCQRNNDGSINEIQPVYIAKTKAEYDTMRSAYEEVVAQALSVVPNSADDLARTFILHDWLCGWTDYNYDASWEGESNDPDYTKYPEAFTSYGCMVSRSGVCQGYSLALSDLLNRVGVEAKALLVFTENHAWNMVKIAGSWYHIDATWDDESMSEYPETEGWVSRDYFMKSDTAFQDDFVHTNWQAPGNYGWDASMVASDTTYDEYDWDTYKSDVIDKLDPSDPVDPNPTPNPDPDPSPAPDPDPDPDPTPDPDPDPDSQEKGIVMRFEGENRYETMGAIMSGTKASDIAVLASGNDFPDALAASSLAGVYDAPILLTETHSLNSITKIGLDRLEVKTVYVLGGTSSVDNSVLDEIREMGITPIRVSGESRQETSIKVFGSVLEQNATCDSVIVAAGNSFPDTLSISAYAYAKKTPIVLTGGNGELTDQACDAIKNVSSIKNVIIVGGERSVKESVKSQLGDGYNYTRLAGSDRYETSKKIAQFELEQGMTAKACAIASGTTFPDALTGAVLSGETNTILLLVNSGKTKDAEEVLVSQAEIVEYLYVYGGDASVGYDVVKLCADAADIDSNTMGILNSWY